jgi:hypothetical protein
MAVDQVAISNATTYQTDDPNVPIRSNCIAHPWRSLPASLSHCNCDLGGAIPQLEPSATCTEDASGAPQVVADNAVNRARGVAPCADAGLSERPLRSNSIGKSAA